MFSVIFPGQGSQSVGMAKNLYNKYGFIKELFDKADEILGFYLSKIILEGPKEELDQTENTQLAIFLVSYSIFEMIKRETDLDIAQVKYFAGHSLGEYSALAASGFLDFDQAITLLKTRGKAMQTAIPKGEGGICRSDCIGAQTRTEDSSRLRRVRHDRFDHERHELAEGGISRWSAVMHCCNLRGLRCSLVKAKARIFQCSSFRPSS